MGISDNKTILKIKSLADSGNVSGNSAEEIFARCYNAVKKTLHITPFDEQLTAAIALSKGRMVQMQTGEGKTLCAVFAACAHALNGGYVHVLTFNDYLANRDYKWMKPVYDEMGVSIGVITEKTPPAERKSAYQKQVVYSTAKETCFDYLRDFVELETEKMCFPKFDFAVFDEADSILIDEARIPLVIAGDVAVKDDGSVKEVYGKIADFNENDFEIDEETKNVYLTDNGADKAEEVFGAGSIYSAKNAGLLAKICACLKAREVLKEDKDYIIKDGKIVLVDEFTGRTAPGRVFPGELQSAAEAKHGLTITSRGRIIGSIPLQYFARLYPKISGMTGTAESAREEFEKFYGILTETVPTRLPCVRIDNPLELYFDNDEKQKAVIDAIKTAYKAQRPVLVGTQSIEESEKTAEILHSEGIPCAVLNAKNDEEEAGIIANAGNRGAVTISTNMAGRGVDIKLGGEDGKNRDFVVNAGGLLVISTAMHESERITLQLCGRAGRQGDVGESRCFAALDDEIMVKNGLQKLCGRHYPSEKISGALTDKTLLKEAGRIQRISEGDAFDEREKLMKYTMIVEKHRKITFERRYSLLDGTYQSDIWKKNASDLYEKAVEKFGEEPLEKLENTVLAALLNEFHSDYLDYTTYLREGIHLTQIAGRNPAEEYAIACDEYYENAVRSIPERMTEKLEDILKCERLDDYTIEKPSRIYTYLLNDIAEEFKVKPILLNVFSDEDKEEIAKETAKEKKPAEDNGNKTGFFKKLFGKK